MIYLFVFFMILLSPIGIYFYFYFKRFANFIGFDTNKRNVKLFIILICLVLLYFCANPFNVWIVIFGHLFFFCLMMDLLMYILKKVKKLNKRVESIYKCGFIPILLTAVVLTYAHYNIKDIVQRDYTIYTDKELSTSYRVVFLSDLHYPTTMDLDYLEEQCERIEKTNPDFVILGGDIVDESTTYDEMKEVFNTLGNIESKYGVFFIYGNHDKSKYEMISSDYTEEELRSVIEESSIISLVDEVYTVNDEFTLIGRDDTSFPKNAVRKEASTLMEEVDKDDFLLVLDHHPVDLSINADLKYDLQLSGHTHGGQIFPTGLVTEWFGNGLNYGYEKIKDFQVIVSSGIGGWAYPFRTGNNSEYLVIDIKNN